MGKADHIKVIRMGYYHHGIDMGDGTVVHFTGEPLSKSNAVVKRTFKHSFSKGEDIEFVFYNKCMDPEWTYNTALQNIGTSGYHLVFNNCEHFATYCKIGTNKSEQVKDATSTTAVASSLVATEAVGISAVSAAGTVAGLSGSGIMSGLVGIGGSAIGGLGVLASIPAVATNIGMNKILEDNDHLTDEERESRSAGRIATKIGTVAGAIGTVGTISAAGTVAGLSGAGITSGLAAIGGTVGGGMLAGTAMAVAAPAVAAAAIGYGVYRVFKWFKK